jgi:hypothetical protein
VTLTVRSPPHQLRVLLVYSSVYVQLAVSSACLTVTVLPATVIVPVRAVVAVFGAAE